MERKIVTKNEYKPFEGSKPVGVSCTVPRLSLSVSELVKRFTLTTLKEMEAKSLLNYDFGPEVAENPLELIEKMDLKVATCIDLTDVESLTAEAKRQMEEYKELYSKELEAQSAEAKAKEDASKEAAYKEFLSRMKSDGVKID